MSGACSLYDFLEASIVYYLSLVFVILLLFLILALSVLDLCTRFYLVGRFSGVKMISYLGSCLQAEHVSHILE